MARPTRETDEARIVQIRERLEELEPGHVERNALIEERRQTIARCVKRDGPGTLTRMAKLAGMNLKTLDMALRVINKREQRKLQARNREATPAD